MKTSDNMPYRRGDRNDHRTYVDFIERLISEGKARFRIRTGEIYDEM